MALHESGSLVSPHVLAVRWQWPYPAELDLFEILSVMSTADPSRAPLAHHESCGQHVAQAAIASSLLSPAPRHVHPSDAPLFPAAPAMSRNSTVRDSEGLSELSVDTSPMKSSVSMSLSHTCSHALQCAGCEWAAHLHQYEVLHRTQLERERLVPRRIQCFRFDRCLLRRFVPDLDPHVRVAGAARIFGRQTRGIPDRDVKTAADDKS